LTIIIRGRQWLYEEVLFILSLYLVVALGFFNKSVLKPKANYDLVNRILEDTKSEVSEYGLRVTFSTENGGVKEFMDIIERLNLSDDVNINIIKDNNLYTLEFNMEGLAGYMSYFGLENKGKVIIDIVEYKETLELSK
jgi:hypothetical protein